MSITLNQITSILKTTNHKGDHIINSNKFMQDYSIPINMIPKINEMSSNIDGTSQGYNFIYVKNEILEFPAYFSDFLDLNKYYIYGCENYLESINLILDSKFKILSITEKEEFIRKFKNYLLENLNSTYKKMNYTSKNIKKPEIKEAIETSSFHINLYKYISDILSINILIINLENKTFMEFKCHDIDNAKNNIILLRHNTNIMPIIHMYNEVFSYKDLQKIKSHFKEYKTLNKITTYSLNELYDIAEKNNISIYTGILEKKKTKAILYNEICNSFEN